MATTAHTISSHPHRREISPEVLQTVRNTKQRCEDSLGSQYDNAGELVRWPHPKKTIEILFALFHEWMGTFEINWLARQQTDGICIGSSYFVMRKVRMKVEGGNTLEQAEFVQVSIGCHRHQIVGSFNGCGAKPVFVHHRHTESFHQ